MNKVTRILLLLTIFVFLFNCTFLKKGKYKYVKEDKLYVFSDEDDLGEKVRTVKDKTKLVFGDRVMVLESKVIDDVNYQRIQYSDKKKYWIKRDALANGFIAIKKQNVPCYNEPNDNYLSTIELQPGDFGILIKKDKNWLNVDFWTFRPHIEGGKRKLVGNRWIKDKGSIYTDKINITKEAYYHYKVYYYSSVEGSKEQNLAKYFLNKGLDISKTTKKSSFVTKLLLSYEEKLTKDKEKTPE